VDDEDDPEEDDGLVLYVAIKYKKPSAAGRRDQLCFGLGNSTWTKQL
jgi:hypothetical protein